jgi:hypothetical protein
MMLCMKSACDWERLLSTGSTEIKGVCSEASIAVMSDLGRDEIPTA